ncbi:VanZ family protein [Compostimonas suwonensis]|uniref:VanZ like protein n=1 Tax=Compostimonas suwonensis TaxID=1048394 RepID=A0A2M9BC61_9MICO|nr:VanZ family protein [Compostimonas suwonensis]PJJ55540.1 VanZ like protein [Compostimonas suwonensis]
MAHIPERRTASWLAVAYAIAVGLIAFWPVPVDRAGYGTLLRVIDWLQEHGMPWLNYSIVEFGANILFFVPFGILGVFILGARRWWLTIVLGFVATAGIEIVQYTFLSNRYATADDIIANTTGAVIGTVIGLVAIGIRAATRAARRPRPVPARAPSYPQRTPVR